MITNRHTQLALLVPLSLFTLGLGLQSFFGYFPLHSIAYPINVMAIVLILSASVSCCALLPKHPLVVFLASGKAAISALIFIGILCFILGFTHQNNHSHDIAFQLGWRNLTHYYPFVLAYLFLIITLCFATIRRFKWEFSVHKLAFFLNHAGLLLVLMSIGFGASDRLDLRVSLLENSSCSDALSLDGENHQLPFELELLDFQMENYSPKLGIIERSSQNFLPIDVPEFYDIDSASSSFSLLDEQFEILQYLEHSERSDSTNYTSSTNQHSPPAIKLRTGKHESWVSYGSSPADSRIMPISNHRAIVMLKPEARSYCSLVKISKEFATFEQTIKVNHPIHIGAWSVYQSSFKKSDDERFHSIFQLVYNPWKILTQIGFFMLIGGAIGLFWGTKKTHS